MYRLDGLNIWGIRLFTVYLLYIDSYTVRNKIDWMLRIDAHTSIAHVSVVKYQRQLNEYLDWNSIRKYGISPRCRTGMIRYVRKRREKGHVACYNTCSKLRFVRGFN